MGRGDRRTKRGKIFKQSYGKHRLAKKNHVAYVPKPSTAEDIIEKAAVGKAEVVATVKEKKVVTVKTEKKEVAEKKAKVLKIEELSPEVLAEVKIEKPEKKAPAEKKEVAEKKVTAEKKAAPAKKETIEKEPKATAAKVSKPKAVAPKDKTAAKKAKS
jgi:ribosomal small subunit protein bTHX